MISQPAEHRLTFLHTGTCLLAGGSATLIPDFPKIRGRAVSGAAAASNYRCDTHMRAFAHTRPATQTQQHACPDFSQLKSSKWREPPPTPSSFSSSSLLISDERAPVRRCSVHQPTLAEMEAKRQKEQMNTEAANKDSNKSIWRSTGHCWELA